MGWRGWGRGFGGWRWRWRRLDDESTKARSARRRTKATDKLTTNFEMQTTTGIGMSEETRKFSLGQYGGGDAGLRAMREKIGDVKEIGHAGEGMMTVIEGVE